MKSLNALWTDRLERDRERASRWPVKMECRLTEEGHRLGAKLPQWHLVCNADKKDKPCGRSVLVMVSVGDSYQYAFGEIQSAVIAHINACHLFAGSGEE